MSKAVLNATVAASLFTAGAVQAAVITVDSFTDADGCTLEAALAAAESNRRVGNCAAGDAGAVDEIRFRSGMRGTFATLRSTLVTDSVRIIGNGREQTAIDSSLVVQTAADGEFALVAVEMRQGLMLWRAGEVRVEGVRFAELGNEMLHGSAIATPMAVIDRLSISDSDFLRNPGSLGAVALSPTAQIRQVDIRRSRFVGNRTFGDGRGSGALYIGARTELVTIADSDFVGNSTVHGAAGAIAVEQPTWLSIEGSVFDGNESPAAGALWAAGSELDVVNSSLTRNRGGDAGAIQLLGGTYFGLRFSAVVDNVSPSGAPALNLDQGPGWVDLLGNVLRAPPRGRVCGWAPVASSGYNQEYQGETCTFHSGTDLAQLGFPLAAIVAGTDRPRVPMPSQHGPGSDRVAFHRCLRSDHTPLTVDIRGRERPWSNGFPDPDGWCDVGPVEQRAQDFPASYWQPSIPPYLPGTSP